MTATYYGLTIKLYCDTKHKQLDLKVEDPVYLRFHKGYSLVGKLYPKTSQQRLSLFKILKRVGNSAYELDLPVY